MAGRGAHRGPRRAERRQAHGQKSLEVLNDARINSLKARANENLTLVARGAVLTDDGKTTSTRRTTATGMDRLGAKLGEAEKLADDSAGRDPVAAAPRRVASGRTATRRRQQDRQGRRLRRRAGEGHRRQGLTGSPSTRWTRRWRRRSTTNSGSSPGRRGRARRADRAADRRRGTGCAGRGGRHPRHRPQAFGVPVSEGARRADRERPAFARLGRRRGDGRGLRADRRLTLLPLSRRRRGRRAPARTGQGAGPGGARQGRHLPGPGGSLRRRRRADGPHPRRSGSGAS